MLVSPSRELGYHMPASVIVNSSSDEIMSEPEWAILVLSVFMQCLWCHRVDLFLKMSYVPRTEPWHQGASRISLRSSWAWSKVCQTKPGLAWRGWMLQNCLLSNLLSWHNTSRHQFPGNAACLPRPHPSHVTSLAAILRQRVRIAITSSI